MKFRDDTLYYQPSSALGAVAAAVYSLKNIAYVAAYRAKLMGAADSAICSRLLPRKTKAVPRGHLWTLPSSSLLRPARAVHGALEDEALLRAALKSADVADSQRFAARP